MHVQNEKYENFVSMSPFTGRPECAAQKLKKTFAVLVYVEAYIVWSYKETKIKLGPTDFFY